MKKYLPLILLGLGVLVLASAIFFFVRSRRQTPEEDETVAEIPLDQRPVVSLTPTDDGHWLVLTIEKLVFEAESLDYELLYKLPDGRTQGVPGTIKLAGQSSIERELLLGSESSGKFRYDEGVEEGTLTLRFRNEKGKLTGKLSTQFSLLSGTDTLSISDGKITYTLDEESDAYFIVMESFGYPQPPTGDLTSAVYGIFTSGEDSYPGVVEIKDQQGYYRWADGRFDQETANSTGEMPDVGIFAGNSNIPEG